MDKYITIFIIILCQNISKGYKYGKPVPPPKVRPPNGEDEPMKSRYEILYNLRFDDPYTRIIGLGRCLGNFYFFINRPYIYYGKNELVYNLEKSKFALLPLKPSKLINYYESRALLTYVCNDENCINIDDKIYMSTFVQNRHCNVLVKKNEFQVEYFSLETLQITTLKNIVIDNYGIPFSLCNVPYPIVRMLLYSDFRIFSNCSEKEFASNYTEKDCREYSRKFKSLRPQELTMISDHTKMTTTIG